MKIVLFKDMDIQALVDDELSQEEAKNVRKFMEADCHASKRYEELLRQKNLLKDWWNKTRN
jgi:anti-sigma factor RsiW